MDAERVAAAVGAARLGRSLLAACAVFVARVAAEQATLPLVSACWGWMLLHLPGLCVRPCPLDLLRQRTPARWELLGGGEAAPGEHSRTRSAWEASVPRLEAISAPGVPISCLPGRSGGEKQELVSSRH